MTALNDALFVGQEQVYRPLEEGVVPALQKSSTFGNFVDDLSSLEVCIYVLVPFYIFVPFVCFCTFLFDICTFYFFCTFLFDTLYLFFFLYLPFFYICTFFVFVPLRFDVCKRHVPFFYLNLSFPVWPE